MPVYRVSLRIQSKCGKIRTRITPNTDTFHAVITLAFIGIVSNQWSAWSQWSSCSSKCSVGMRRRNRQFNNIVACCDCNKQTQIESCGTPNNGCEQKCNEENGSCACKTGYVLNQGKWLKLLSMWKYRSSYLQVFYREAALAQHCSRVFIVNFEHIVHLVIVFLLLHLSR